MTDHRPTAAESIEERDDESLAALCAEGIEAAERELLRRHMQAVYWLPRRAFGAPEEELSGFLLYAVEKIRQREILSKYDPERGAGFATWFGVVVRRLYLDYLRAQRDEPPVIGSTENLPAAPAGDAEADEAELELLRSLEIRCRALFKLLLCDTVTLAPEEVRWISEESGRSLLEAAEAVARMEERLRVDEVALGERYDRLAAAHWWKTAYERRLQRAEKAAEHPWTEDDEALAALERKRDRRHREYIRLAEELRGGAGLVTAPYRDLAALLNVNEGTLASRISRCRARAAELAGRGSTGRRS